MSTLAYGRLVKRREEIQRSAIFKSENGKTDKDESKLLTAVAGIVPVEIIAAHGLIVASTTTTDAAGTTSITSPDPLRWSLILLIAASMIVYLVGRGTDFGSWTRADYVRLVLPAGAFVVWTALIGTSALSPWVAGIDHAWVTMLAAVFGIILLAVSAKVVPSET